MKSSLDSACHILFQGLTRGSKHVWWNLLFWKIGLISSILSFVFSMSWNISQKPFDRKFFVSFTSSGTSPSFQRIGLLINVNKFFFSLSSWLYLKGLKQWQCEHFHGQCFLLLTIFMFDLNFTSSIIIFCFFTAHSPLPANSLSVVHVCKMPLWIYHWEGDRRQLCCQCVNWRKYVHWPITVMNRLKDVIGYWSKCTSII